MIGLKERIVTLIFMFLNIKKSTENSTMEPFIVHGNFVKLHNYPHCVYIYINCYGSWSCGSSILNQNILITAAHCLNSCGRNAMIEAFAGHEDLNKVTVYRRARDILIHENYDNNRVRNDIGLILLKEGLPLGIKIQRVILKKQDNQGFDAEVAGWGVVNDQTMQGTDFLKSAKQIVRSTVICNTVGTLLPGMMCAGSFYESNPRPSQGDSGSALITGNHHQIGIVSFRYPSYPGLVVYSNISYFYDWIKIKSNLFYCGRLRNTLS